MKLGIFSVMDFHQGVHGSAADFYRQTIDYALMAERYGLDSFWLAEHHFSDYGLCPSPVALLSHIAARTKTIKLGPAVAVLPYHDPVKLAEEYAVLDVLSQGRLEMGVGKGYLADEYLGHDVAPEDGQQRFIESLAIIQALWAKQSVTFSGEHFSLKHPIALNTLPLQPDGPALSFAVLRAQGFEKVGELGHHIMGIPYLMSHLDELEPALAHYRRGLESGNHRHDDFNATMALHIHVAATNAQAREQAEPYIARYCQTRAVGNTRDFDELMEKQLIAVGDPAHVAAQLQKMAAFGTDRVLALMDFGGMPEDLLQSSLALLAQQVYPVIAGD